jgi:hypothetical protein
MTPDFDELVGTGLEPNERARLERVHELLLAAGPPPATALPTPAELRPRRRRGVLLALAAALAVTAFAFGATLVDGSGREVDFTETMTGTAAAADASALLTVFVLDDAGNWPMQLEVKGLPQPQQGRPFELWLTRDGKLAALCGGFLTDARGAANIPLNAPYRFDKFDGWVVVEEGSDTPLLTT